MVEEPGLELAEEWERELSPALAPVRQVGELELGLALVLVSALVEVRDWVRVRDWVLYWEFVVQE